MPYTTETAPDYVKKLPDKKKRQWVSVFNSAYAKAKKDGKSDKDAEAFAFRNANSIVKKVVDFVMSLMKEVYSSDVDTEVKVNERRRTEYTDNGSESQSTVIEERKQTVISTFAKSILHEGLIYGIVYEPFVKDAHGDWASDVDIKKAAHDFLPRALMDTEHSHDSPNVEVVESYLAPADFSIGGQIIRKGSWVLVSRVHEGELKNSIESWQAEDAGGYSLEGTAVRI